MAQINEAIGASGLASQECKSVVSQYGDMIMELLMAQVRFPLILEIYLNNVWLITLISLASYGIH